MKEFTSSFFAIIAITISVLALFFIIADTYHLLQRKRYKTLIWRRLGAYLPGLLFAIHFIVEKSKVLF